MRSVICKGLSILGVHSGGGFEKCGQVLVVPSQLVAKDVDIVADLENKTVICNKNMRVYTKVKFCTS